MIKYENYIWNFKSGKNSSSKGLLDYKNIDVEILSLKDIGFNEEIDENGTTFEGKFTYKSKSHQGLL